ncbi:sugar transferase [Epilithonimonas hominis]|uniref:Sugar transferase involved in LPS biosynthesis (Colanic, teichoic acid) n=1 Tax=Epilithonimonas hominis TaxID=420404 RepID=A0A1H6KKM0_9FLAO|nr:sugar transferase [Epilithonimonas hominis]SEH76209.1 Sugar transferase involved in LPS biosynthesis (colanic, teichoic acid) [Epilithonimonas hominis]
MYKNILKPIFDYTFSFLLILILSPLLLLLIMLLYFFNQKNVFFFQSRPGKNERVFQIIKFKTMTDEKDQNGNLLPDEKRLTKMGKFVRKTSLDELPQLFNVLKGDMSFIGPRPLLVSYLTLYNDEQKKRHHIKPGITGWAQVNGRNAITWEQKFIFDVFYVNNISFTLDLKIFLLTIKKVLKSEGINTIGVATTESFKGNDNE